MDAQETTAAAALDGTTPSALLDQITARLHERLAPEQAAEAAEFARQYYRHVAPEDLAERSPEDLYGAALSHWQFARGFATGAAKLRVYNPRPL